MKTNNFIVNTSYVEPIDFTASGIFGDVSGDEAPVLVEPGADIYDILVAAGVFQSKKQAQKNWAKTGWEIPPGYTELKGVGKMRRDIAIWNPVFNKTVASPLEDVPDKHLGSYPPEDCQGCGTAMNDAAGGYCEECAMAWIECMGYGDER